MKYQRKSNQGFDRFLIHEWLESCEEISATEECGKEIRKQAYQAFRKAAKGEKPADLHTMRRWFGLDGISSPNREMVFLFKTQCRKNTGISSERIASSGNPGK